MNPLEIIDKIFIIKRLMMKVNTVVCPNLQSAMRPVPHWEELLISKPPEHVILDEESGDS